MSTPFTTILIALGTITTGASAQYNPEGRMPASPDDRWQQCTRLATDPAARLACFDRWAQSQAQPVKAPAAAPETAALPASPPAQTTAAAESDCRSDQYSELSRFWELEAGSDCGRFRIRGYRPVSLSWITSDSVNTEPSSPTPNHTAGYQPYLQSEGRIQLSVRTKFAQGLLPVNAGGGRDSLWFAYTQQSYWQLFTPSLSRPFRSTDHEPEIIYILPTDAGLPLGWRLRYSGISINHQSNGQTLPLSRSWNRIILMAGMEKNERFTVTGRLWQRMPEDIDSDDNPGISDYIGRAELGGSWQVDKNNTLALTVRSSLNQNSNGSLRLEWLSKLGDSGKRGRDSGLRFHTQIFSGYGDSLMDYNRLRTVLSIGLSLVDW